MRVAVAVVVAVAAGCSGKERDPSVGSARDDAQATIDAAPAIDAAPPVDAAIAHGPGGPALAPACEGGTLVPALARLGLDGWCATRPDLHHAAVTVRGKRVVVVSSRFGPTVFVDRRAISDSQTATHTGGEWWVLEELERRLGGRRALAKLTDGDAAALLAALRGMRLDTFSVEERFGRFGFTEADVVVLHDDWPAVAATVDTPEQVIDPAAVYLRTGPDGRSVAGWYEKIERNNLSDCTRLIEIGATLTRFGELELRDHEHLRRGDGCPVYPPDQRNLFPD